MKKYQREAILISFLSEKEKFNVHLIQNDPSLPKGSLHTITYRIKNEFRLIDKINKLNQTRETNETAITVKNYRERVKDLLGVRIICLRLKELAMKD